MFLKKQKRWELNRIWAKFFYEANIPFIVSKNKAFKEAAKKIVDFCWPYGPHSYHDLCRKFLVQAKEELQEYSQVKMVDSVCKFGATLAVNGWSSMTNCPLFNAMLVSLAVEKFLRLVDTTRYQKIVQYQASIMEQHIKEVGPYNVVQICTDNASSMEVAADIITNKYLHIYFQGCVVHTMNLLLEDWGKVTWMKEVLKKLRTIVKFIKRQHMLLVFFPKHEEKLSLLMPGKIRFGSKFIIVDWLLQVKIAMQQSVVDPQWVTYVIGL
jgi:hypothetical protein